MSLTYLQQDVHVGLVEFIKQHVKQSNGHGAALPQQTTGCKCYEEVANFLITSYYDSASAV